MHPDETNIETNIFFSSVYVVKHVVATGFM